MFLCSSPLPKLYDVHDQCDKPQDTQANIISPMLKPQPSNIKERYKPLQLPHILHDFPPKHYKYLPYLMENLVTLQLKNIFKLLSILQIFLKLNMMMFA
jgi:hypothetical protein